MKVCVPVQKDNGLKSRLSQKFIYSQIFLIINTDSAYVKKVENFNENVDRLAVLKDEKFDSLIVDVISKGTIEELGKNYIKVYKPRSEVVIENIEFLKQGLLLEQK